MKKGKSKVKVKDFKHSKFGKWRTATFGEGKGKEVYWDWSKTNKKNTK